MRKAIAVQSTWPEKLDTCIQACFRGFQSEHDLHEVLFRHVGHAEWPRRQSSHHLLVETFRALLTDGTNAGAFEVEDIAATSLLLACTIHAFDPTFPTLTTDRLSGQRLLHATQAFGRRGVGIAAPPPPVRQPRRAQ